LAEKMNLKQLLNQGRLRRHKTSKEEIGNLLRVIERDLKDAKKLVLNWLKSNHPELSGN